MAWLGREILPHEAAVRAWLRRSLAAAGDADDVIQEAYCRLAGLASIDHIESPRAYFFQTARSVALEQLRRARVVRIETVTEIDALNVELDEPSPERIAATWRRVAVVSVLMTPAVSLLVLTTEHLLTREPFGWPSYQRLLWQVWPILLAVMVVRTLAWRRPPARVETLTVIAAPLPEAETAFRRRLSAKRRGARLIAIEAHDHYLRVHTDAGAELITLRFAEALDELALGHGWRVHRSWWVAADAVEEVRWRRGAGEARLVGGLIAPVSRTYAPTLKEAGWF
jgi:hypothetical protein